MSDPLLDELELQCDVVAAQLNVAAQSLAMIRRTILRANADVASPPRDTDADGDEDMQTYERTTDSLSLNGGR